MASHRVELVAPTDGAIATLTRAHPRLRVEAIPLGSRILLTCHGPYPGDERLAEHLGVAPDRVRSMAANGSRTVVVKDAGHVRALLDLLESADATLLPPLSWTGGRLHLRLLAPGADALRRVTDALGGARIVSKRSAAPARGTRGDRQGFLGSLTPKQAQALDAAVAHGYYESPRRVTTGDVARAVGVSRSTFEEHLRAAEGHVVRAVAPLVRVRSRPDSDADAGDAVQAYARFSEELGLFVQLRLREGRVETVRLTEEAPEGRDHPDHPFLVRILQHLATGRGDLSDIPVHLDVGPFEQQVLEALRDVPAGRVLTYGELARRLGNPRAARAVGQALAKNPVPLLLPCHRVVPSGGGVGHYSGGRGGETKKRLLEREGAWPPRHRSRT